MFTERIEVVAHASCIISAKHKTIIMKLCFREDLKRVVFQEGT